MKPMIQARKHLRIAALCASISFVVSGCATVPSDTELQASRDECSQYRQPFLEIARERDARIQRWASIGAAGGVAAGAAIAQSQGEDPAGRRAGGAGRRQLSRGGCRLLRPTSRRDPPPRPVCKMR